MQSREEADSSRKVVDPMDYEYRRVYIWIGKLGTHLGTVPWKMFGGCYPELPGPLPFPTAANALVL